MEHFETTHQHKFKQNDEPKNSTKHMMKTKHNKKNFKLKQQQPQAKHEQRAIAET